MPADLPMPTPILASASVVTLEARPQKNVIALQNANASGHDVAPVQPVGEPRDRDAERRIKQHEAEAREQAHRGVESKNSFLIGSIRTLKMVRSRKFRA